jgi:hypothetical protein
MRGSVSYLEAFFLVHEVGIELDLDNLPGNAFLIS